MARYLFGCENGKMTRREQRERESAAKKHDAEFTYARMPEGPRSWFSCQNLGHPFDAATEQAVLAEIN